MSEHQHWVSVWGNAVSVAENRPERYAKDITIRYPILIPFNGAGLRLTFDNYCGTEPITLNKVTVLHNGVFHPIFFGGNREVTIGAHDRVVSDALTVTAVPVFVEPVIHPVVLVTLGVTLTEWLDTVPLVADGVPAVPLGTLADA